MRRYGPGTGPIPVHAGGFTRIELLIVTTITALVFAVGIPGMRSLIVRSDGTATMMELRRFLEHSRQTAITRGVDILVCGTANGVNCTRNWSGIPLVAYVDRNRNRLWDKGDERIAITQISRNATVRWRASGGRNYLRFVASGGVLEFGTFTYCPRIRDINLVRRMTINFTGRPRDLAVRRMASDAANQTLFTALCP